MTLLKEWELDPFDLLWKNLFDTNSNFNSVSQKINYPVDIYETDDSICFELAAVGLEKEDIGIETQGDTLRITSTNQEPDNSIRYIHKGVARRKFDLAWKVTSKYDLNKLTASLNKGLLKIEVPFAESKQIKKVTIK